MLARYKTEVNLVLPPLRDGLTSFQSSRATTYSTACACLIKTITVVPTRSCGTKANLTLARRSNQKIQPAIIPVDASCKPIHYVRLGHLKNFLDGTLSMQVKRMRLRRQVRAALSGQFGSIDDTDVTQSGLPEDDKHVLFCL